MIRAVHDSLWHVVTWQTITCSVWSCSQYYTGGYQCKLLTAILHSESSMNAFSEEQKCISDMSLYCVFGSIDKVKALCNNRQIQRKWCNTQILLYTQNENKSSSFGVEQRDTRLLLMVTLRDCVACCCACKINVYSRCLNSLVDIFRAKKINK